MKIALKTSKILTLLPYRFCLPHHLMLQLLRLENTARQLSSSCELLFNKSFSENDACKV